MESNFAQQQARFGPLSSSSDLFDYDKTLKLNRLCPAEPGLLLILFLDVVYLDLSQYFISWISLKLPFAIALTQQST